MAGTPTTDEHSLTLNAKALLDVLPDPFVVLDEHGHVRHYNASWRAFIAANGLDDAGLTVGTEYVAGFSATFAPRPADADALAVGLQAILSGDLPHFELDSRYQAADAERWLMLTIVPWDGGALIQHRDVSQHKRDEQALRQAEAMLAVMPDLMFRLSRAGEYLDCKISRDHELYLSPEQIIGKRLHDLLPSATADAWLEWIARALDSGRTQVYEYRMPTPHGARAFEARLLVSGVDEVLTIVRDITERTQAEEALRLSADQQQLIRLQAAALRELSTPLIPISDDVLVMPLVGALDTTRTQQVIEALLHGVAAGHARTAILDITGVPVVDTQVANALLQAAQSVRLLGAQVLITGIRPEVAQTLVGLGVDLSLTITRATLQDGIAYAMRRKT
jgi:PAS domain S-box-containing protein